VIYTESNRGKMFYISALVTSGRIMGTKAFDNKVLVCAPRTDKGSEKFRMALDL
jgi:hypothetical protein